MLSSPSVETCKFLPGNSPQPGEVKPNVDVGARVPEIDAASLEQVKLPADYMPMLCALQNASSDKPPYVEAKFAELTASETSQLVAK